MLVEVHTNSERRSSPPQTRLPDTSGVSMMPSSSPDGASTQIPPRAVHHTLPSASHSIPSGLPLPGTPVLPIWSCTIRTFDSDPSGATS